METYENQVQEKSQDGEYGFVWQDYLDATNSMEVPQIMFPHVELTLESSIEVGMSLEVPVQKNNAEEEQSYWIASIVMACGPLLRLRYLGGDDRSLEFWFNLTKEAGHELGWSVKNNKKLKPPDVIFERSPDCVDKLQEFLITARTLPPEMLTGDGLSMTERIKQGMKVEISDVLHPHKLWVATIIENIGGRLLLKYDTPESTREDFWIFCTSERLHPYGFTSKSNSTWFLEPPSSIIDMHTYEEWKDLLESKPKDCKLEQDLFNNNIDHSKHSFEIGMKLEALHPADRIKICPATVTKVFDDAYFLVNIDVHSGCLNESNNTLVSNNSSSENNTWLCTVDHPYIFPVGWAQNNDIMITHPQGWTSKTGDFDWNEYLEALNASAAPENLFSEHACAIEAGFECGMRLEAVDPEHEHVICAAHINKIVDNLLWIKLDNNKYFRPDHIVDMYSLHIFPVGWCESNHYSLKPPHDYIEICKKLETSAKEKKKSNVLDIPISEPRSSLWCPKIYFNYRCFTGPMISKGKLATLPKSVGPGPVILVMREVLSMIVSVGYRSARILKVLQCDTKPDPGYHLEVLKAKHKNNTYRASVAIVTSGDMVADFCRNTCKKLLVCPNLFGPLHISENECPDECYKTSKTKYTASIGTGKRGKPKGYTSIMVQKPKPWGRKRKRRRGRWAQKHKEVQEEYDQEDELPYISLDLVKHISENLIDEEFDGRQPLSEIDIMIQKGLEKSDKSDDVKTEMVSSNVSEDSGSSFNDRKPKDRELPSPPNLNLIQHSTRFSQGIGITRGIKRDWDTSIESDCSEADAEYVRMQKTQRRPKTRKLDSNPLYWSVDDVFRYLRKTNDCKDIAYRIKEEEIDGLAFLLLNLPSLTQHMKLRTSLAMKICRHVEQVKVTFFLRHIHEVEPEQYQIV
ncbi:PREDICTED: scm-like with four MBT domains protein 1 [Trachymyrmex cornetzi]|nr:PREDICTED: scm-like with four MBT domains protein 1 [Trachymyrmex cornetzi]XP_018361159.1 PREDICTED: scm-like with four MBT domains protein 1 [Trachymyrmex cornetzi]XP_018361167.1 PREDICTED: scm-like with four MBT domains protein 1 [Trachymyrmex cornetzi]